MTNSLYSIKNVVKNLPEGSIPFYKASKELDEFTPSMLADYIETSVPANKPNWKGQEPDRLAVNYLAINPVHLINRNSSFGEAAWMNMVNHHLFPGHSSCQMVFEQFYGQCENLKEILDRANDENSPYGIRPFELLIVTWLNDNGYHYHHTSGKLLGDDGQVFDGVLLDVCW